MIIKKVNEIYLCEHCRKVYQIKKFCEAHEPKCRKNPDNFSKCFDSCKHLVKKEVTYYWDAYDGSHESKKEILFCDAKNEGVHPFWINNPLCSDDIEGDVPNDVMPTECDDYESKSL